jgi:hypothetical protein
MRIDYKTLKVNDEFWESSQYGNIHCRVINTPVVDQIEIRGKIYDRYNWTAIDIDSGKQLSYTITEGLEHYGPSLYTEPAYVNIQEWMRDTK